MKRITNVDRNMLTFKEINLVLYYANTVILTELTETGIIKWLEIYIDNKFAFFVDVFLTYIRHCYGYILCSFSNRRVPLLVWGRLHVGVSQEERKEIIWILLFSNDNKVTNKNILVKYKHHIDWTENHFYVRYSYIIKKHFVIKAIITLSAIKGHVLIHFI
jgi:hypothetical protein